LDKAVVDGVRSERNDSVLAWRRNCTGGDEPWRRRRGELLSLLSLERRADRADVDSGDLGTTGGERCSA